MPDRNPGRFAAQLLRASAGGFAGLAVSRLSDRSRGGLEGGFDAWQAHFQELVLELAASVEDGDAGEFARRIGWTRDAFLARGLDVETLGVGLEELARVLHDSLPAPAWATLPGYLEAARQELTRTPAPGAEADDGDPVRQLALRFVDAVLRGDGNGAVEEVTSEIRKGRLSPEDALDGVLVGALREVGRLWHDDTINVAEEHFTTMTAGRLLEQIVLQAPRATSRGHTVLLSMVEGDAHELGLRVVAGLFELDGWRTICLGTNTPAEDLARLASKVQADLVVLGATLNTQRDAVGRTIEALRALAPTARVVLGGPAFEGLDERAAELGAAGVATSPRDAVRIGNELVA